MRSTIMSAGALAVVGLALAACSTSPGAVDAAQTPTAASTNPLATSTPEQGADQAIVGTVVHFTAGSVVVRAVIEEDTPTTRSFLAMLPMTLRFSDFGGREKVASPPEAFDFTDATGMTPQAGDLFSYIPWSNIGFFYNAEGSTHSDDLVRIGTTEDIDQIELLDGQDVTIAIPD